MSRPRPAQAVRLTTEGTRLRSSLPRSTSISIASLRALVRARVIAPEDPDHDRARTSFYGGFDRHRRSSSGSRTQARPRMSYPWRARPGWSSLSAAAATAPPATGHLHGTHTGCWYTRPVLRPVNVSSISRRADQLHAVVGASVKHAVHADLGRVDRVLVGHQADAGQVRMTSGHVSTSAVVTTVVPTCTIRSGRPSDGLVMARPRPCHPSAEAAGFGRSTSLRRPRSCTHPRRGRVRTRLCKDTVRWPGEPAGPAMCPARSRVDGRRDGRPTSRRQGV